VANWSGGNAEAVKVTAEQVITCARTILDRTGLLRRDASEETAPARAA
jgi:hypothetical protein